MKRECNTWARRSPSALLLRPSLVTCPGLLPGRFGPVCCGPVGASSNRHALSALQLIISTTGALVIMGCHAFPWATRWDLRFMEACGMRSSCGKVAFVVSKFLPTIPHPKPPSGGKLRDVCFFSFKGFKCLRYGQAYRRAIGASQDSESTAQLCFQLYVAYS